MDPFGQLHAVPDRGTLMGNRGILHDELQAVRRPWAHKAWVACSLSYGDIKRPVFSQGNYSELFFLDEATAFAAGHRPCNTCRRARHVAFKSAWLQANRPDAGATFTRMAEIDAALHAERAIPGGGKRSYEAPLAELPDGAMFEHAGKGYLVWQGKILEWSFGGYAPAAALPSSTTVRVLTPPSIVRMLAAGYALEVHPSASA
ncbi:hypothetical protein [Massilia sp. SYSU DXS3249]